MTNNTGIILAQVGTISGQVADQAGAAVQGAQVTATDAGGNVSPAVGTDNNGDYQIPNLVAGAYDVNVAAQGFQIPPPIQAVQVMAGQDAPGNDFQLQPAQVGTISGQVTDQAGAAVQGAQVTATDAGGNVSPAVGTDNNGDYKIPNLVAGAYDVNVAAQGFQIPPSIQAVQVTVGQDAPGNDFQLQPAQVGTISGQVTDQAGAAVQGAQVTATDAGGNVSPAVGTDNNGDYQIPNLVAGAYDVNVAAQGFQIPPPIQAVQVTVGKDAPGNDFQLQPAQVGTISGQVTDQAGAAVQGAQVTATDAGGNVSPAVGTDNNGDYKIPNLVAGAYDVNVAAQGFQIPPPIQVVQVTVGQDAPGNDFQLQPAQVGTISGQVTDQAGAAVQGAQVTATDAGGNVSPAVGTDNNGDYKIPNLVAGAYDVNVAAQGFQIPPPIQAVQVKVGQDAPGNDFQLEPAQVGTISGQVTDQAGAAVQGAQVTATDAGGNVSPAVGTDNNGDYKIPNLVAGAYDVNVAAQGFQIPVPIQAVQVTAGQDAPGNDFQLQPAQFGIISGQVTNQAGAAVQGAQVTATDAGGNVSPAVGTDNNGDYKIGNLPGGSYKVGVSNLEGHESAINVTVTPGSEIKDINFSLDPVRDFRERLDDHRFSIELPISIKEAGYATDFFSIVNFIFASLDETNFDNPDISGIQALLDTERNVHRELGVKETSDAWSSIIKRAEELKTYLYDFINNDELKELKKEAKRHFNIGDSGEIVGNTEFPVLFKRYVEIGLDPLLRLDIVDADKPQSFVDKENVAKADDLLKELKGVIIKIVRSLSKTGREATERTNENWSPFSTKCLELMAYIGQNFNLGDEDESSILALITLLTGNDRNSIVAPHFVLSKNGGELLDYALEIYQKSQNDLDNFEKDHLRALFQPQGREYYTKFIRANADKIKRYQLPNWG